MPRLVPAHITQSCFNLHLKASSWIEKTQTAIMSFRLSVIAGVLVILSLIAAISAQERRQDEDDSKEEYSPRCRGPTGDLGFCVKYNRCSQLFGSKVNFSVLQRYRCGFSGVVPKVCCPENGNKPPRPILTPTRRTVPATTKFPERRPPQLHRDCGRSKIPGDKIFGGNESTIGAWPWMAALYFEKGGEKKVSCGGTLISSRHVVTASHCFHKENSGEVTVTAKDVTVRLGDHDLNSLDDKTAPVDIGVTRVVHHPKYQYSNFHHDIAILVLKDEVRFNQYVQPICLAYDPPMLTQNYEGRSAYVAGWGISSFDHHASSKLRDVSVPIWSHTKCREAYRGYSLNEDYVCAGFQEGRKDACSGDSGGPLMLSGGLESRFHLVGVVSFGRVCAEANFPGVYTNVRRYLEWIRANIS